MIRLAFVAYSLYGRICCIQVQPGYSSDSSASSTIQVSRPGSFTLTAINKCGSPSDELVVRPGDCLLAVSNELFAATSARPTFEK